MKNLYPNQNNGLSFKRPVKKGFVSIIVPVYRDFRGLKDTLSSLKRQNISNGQYEIIVANDGSNELVSKVCQNYEVTEVKISPQKGSYYARNRAIEFSSGEFILFTDADLEVPNDWILAFRNSFIQGCDYIGGNVLIDRKKIKDEVNYIDFLMGFPIEDAFRNLHFFPTANMAVRRSVIEKIGGFDERLLSGGDLEFGNRVHFFSKSKQVLIKNEIVHPPRGYKSFTKKLKRISHGLRVLYLIYPERFSNFKSSISIELRKMIYIPNLHQTETERFSKPKIFLLLVWFQIIKSFYGIWFLLTISDENKRKNESFFNTEEP